SIAISRRSSPHEEREPAKAIIPQRSVGPGRFQGWNDVPMIDSSSNKRKDMTHELLIDTDQLQQRLGQPGLVILDVRGRAAYEFGGHIPGAAHSTWHEYSDPSAVPKGLLDPDRGRIEQKIRALGISEDSEVIIYSNPFDNWGDEGRMFWMLEYLGHKRLRILDGGWVKWVQEKRPFEYGCVTPKPGTFTVKPVADVIADKDELKHLMKQPHPG